MTSIKYLVVYVQAVKLFSILVAKKKKSTPIEAESDEILAT